MKKQKAEDVFNCIRVLAKAAGPGKAGPGGALRTDRETERVVDEILRRTIPGGTAEMYVPLMRSLSDLMAKANDGSVTDDAFLDAVQEAAIQMPELLAEVNPEPLATALEQAMGTAMVNGALARHEEWEAGR